jgi:hypothetical protein
MQAVSTTRTSGSSYETIRLGEHDGLPFNLLGERQVCGRPVRGDVLVVDWQVEARTVRGRHVSGCLLTTHGPANCLNTGTCSEKVGWLMAYTTSWIKLYN